MQKKSILKKRKKLYNPSFTLDAVLIVVNTIDEFSGEYNQTGLWKNLPKKVMWQTYLVILEYLESINKIAFDQHDKNSIYLESKISKKIKGAFRD
jgi:hypothetical protein